MDRNSKSRPELKSYNRRRFLKQSALTAFGLAASRRLSPAFDNWFSGVPAGEKSKVVLVRHPAVVDADGKVEATLLQEILDKAITTFSGRSTVADAWRQYFSPDDVVGLKINTLGLANVKGTDYTRHFSAFNQAVASGLRRAGIKDQNIVVWDRSEEEMTEAGLAIQKDPGGIRVIANKATRRGPGDYAETAYPVGGLTSRVSRILAEVCTSFINIPVPKTHGNAVFTCSLKNHYGTIDNPGQMHANACTNPGIAEVNAIPIIRKKEKLVVSDALLIVTEMGPRWDRRYIRPFGGVLVGTDPVAVDAVALKILDDQREKDGMERIAPRVPHLALAEKLGLGKSRLEDIDLVAIDLG
jgi:uncharacterized protein (DUF362 family)